MSRPKFPSPYIILPPSIISRIRSEQKHYDDDPEKAEREQAAREEELEEEEEQEWQD